jgi:hypothetical protein
MLITNNYNNCNSHTDLHTPLVTKTTVGHVKSSVYPLVVGR